jgi:hypothetical protein
MPGRETVEKALQKEYQSLMSNGKWTLTDLLAGRKAIGTKLFKIKKDENGKPICYKARLVA